MVDREEIVKSRDLKHALHTKRLGMGHHSVVITPTPQPTTTQIYNTTNTTEVNFDEEKIKGMIRDVLSEQPPVSIDMGDSVQKAVHNSMNPIIDALQKKIESIQTTPVAEQTKPEEKFISDEQLAEMQQKAVQKMTQNMESGENKKTKTFVITGSNLHNIADQL
jgi:hypothetical protein